ncbi:MAG: carbonic anhydrase [bacterium]
MKKLIKGIIEFRRSSLEEYRTKFSKLALEHKPDALFVACCDSRVVPNVFASSDPGDLFVVRNLGNLVPPYHCTSKDDYERDISVSAAIEFSLLGLNIRDIIICGHSSCGAMHALMNHNVESKCLNQWLEYAAPSYKKFEKMGVFDTELTQCDLLSQINVLQQLDNLKTYPLVKERLQNNTLRLHGWWFDLETADVYIYDQKDEKYVLIQE